MNNYTDLLSGSLQDVVGSVDEIIRERRNDVEDYNNLNNRFISGRRTGRIPSSATDVIDGDKVNDFNIAEEGGTVYLYTLVDLGGTAEWRRGALASW